MGNKYSGKFMKCDWQEADAMLYAIVDKEHGGWGIKGIGKYDLTFYLEITKSTKNIDRISFQKQNYGFAEEAGWETVNPILFMREVLPILFEYSLEKA